MKQHPDAHLEDRDILQEAHYDQKPGESQVQTHGNDLSIIPEIEITQQDLYDSVDRADNWLIFGNSYEGQRLVPTDAVTADNVGELTLEWELENPFENASNYQGSPLLVHGDPPILYHSLGTDFLYAVNARTGDVLWSHNYVPYSDGSGSAERGFALYGDMVIKSTVDYGVLAINRYTGEEEWYFNGAAAYRGEIAEDPVHEELAFTKVGPTSSYPPLVYEGTIIKGSMGAEWGVNGWVDGITLDGEPKYRVNTTPEEGWLEEAWTHAGGTSWASGTLDPETGTMISPVSNPAPWYGTVRPGWNPYTAGKLAHDAETGEYRWHYQDSPHDWWDYDSSSPAIVYDADVDGEERRLASWCGKLGWMFTVDAETGQLIQRSEDIVQHYNTWTLPPKGNIDAAEPFMPTGTIGGTNNQPSSYHPDSRTIVITGSNQPFKLAWEEALYQVVENDEMYYGMEFGAVSLDDFEPHNGSMGAVVGVDPVTGEVKWRDWRQNTTRGGTVTTQNGLSFVGTGEGEFIAYKTETGEQLWVGTPGGSLTCHPIVWEDPTVGKFYAAVGGDGDPGKLSVYSLTI